jgi:hypothetical protein
MNGAIHIPLAVAVNYLLCPSTVIAFVPFEIFERGYGATILPVHHIGRSIEEPILHVKILSIILIVAGKKIDSVIVYNRSRVGSVLGLDDRHVQ